MVINAARGALAGKRIVLTRSREESGILARELKDLGAQSIVLPFIEFQPAENLAPLDSALARLTEFDWLVFTSRNTVRFFCRRLCELGRVPADLPPPRPRIATIGAGTADAAASERLRVDFIASEARSGEEFVAEFLQMTGGKRILLPQSDQAGGHIADSLRQGGAHVTPIVAYRTCMPESLDGAELARVRSEGADVFVFASPSAFKYFAQAIGDTDLKRIARTSVFAAIGPTTAQAIREAGVSVAIEAAKPSSDEIIKAMIDYFSKAGRSKAHI